MAEENSAQVPASVGDNGEWGWEALGSEDDNGDTNPGTSSVPLSPCKDDADNVTKGTLKKTSSKSNSVPHLKGITSSPSFLELEKAIGATLALSLTSSDSGDLSDKSTSPMGLRSKLSSTNLTQQKVHHQRMRQQHQDKRHSPYSQQQMRFFPPSQQYQQQPYPQQYILSNNTGSFNGLAQLPTAQAELSSLIDDTATSRALLLFHSPAVSPAMVHNACAKFGVLYYIRPEFHGRGVTLLAYFDSRAAVDAKNGLAGELGSEAAASAHYSVMLHAATENSEEARLVVEGLSLETTEEQVREVFGRYGHLKMVAQLQPPQQPVVPPQNNTESPDVSTVSQQPDVVSPVSQSECATFEVEFYSIQDARVALSELVALVAQQAQQLDRDSAVADEGESKGDHKDNMKRPWGRNTIVRAAAVESDKQQRCRQLVATLGRWRHEMAPYYHPQMQQQQQQQQMMMHSLLQINIAQATAGALAPQHHPFPQLISPSATSAQMAGATGYMTNYPTSAIPAQTNGSTSVYDDQRQFENSGTTVAPPIYYSSLSHSGSTDSLTALTAAMVGNQPSAQNQQNQMFAATAAAASFTNRDHVSPEFTMTQQQQQQFYQAQQQQLYQQQQMYVMYRGNSDNHLTMQHQQQQQQRYQQFQQQQSYPRNMHGQNGRNDQSVEPHLQQQPYRQHYSAGAQQQQQYPNGGMHRAPPHHHNGGHNVHPSTQFNGNRPQHRPGQVSGHAMGRGGAGMVVMSNGHAITGHGVTGHQHTIDADFALDLTRIGEDKETRTTIMVRNIPNKYNQAMLLEEVNARHEGTYDFFYLPIDFKNRCNVGYAFINFLDPHYIGPFVKDFDGQRWKSFNSEKVCAVSFARIQGKGAMVARFQNSSLLEKDDEYQPLLFHSSGPDRGKPEPFPSSSGSRVHQQQQHPQQQVNGKPAGAHTNHQASPPLFSHQQQPHGYTVPMNTQFSHSGSVGAYDQVGEIEHDVMPENGDDGVSK